MALSRHKDQRKLQRKVLDEPKGEHQKHMLWETSIEISINIHRTSLDGDGCGSWVNRVSKTTREEEDIQVGAKSRMPEVSRKLALGRESQQKRCQSRPRTKSKGSKSLIERFTFMTQVDLSHGRDKTPEATDQEDLTPSPSPRRGNIFHGQCRRLRRGGYQRR